MRTPDDTINAGGQTWYQSQHIFNRPHEGITDAHRAYVLDNWLLAGTRPNQEGRLARHYFAFVPEIGYIVRVVTSFEGNRVVTSHIDGTATRHWRNGNIEYFRRRYPDLEVRE